MLILSFFIIAPRWKQSKCLLTNPQIDKMWYICTMGDHATCKRNEILIYAVILMDLENIK